MATTWHFSQQSQQRLKILGITAIVIGTTWYIHKKYTECISESVDSVIKDVTVSDHSQFDVDVINDDDIITIEHDILTPEIDITNILTPITPELEEKINIFTPIITTNDAMHGLCSIELSQLTGNETDFEIEFRRNDKIQLLSFNINNIAIDLMTNIKYISCRLPVQLKDYFIEFRIRCKVKDKIQNYWTAFSTKNVIKVPSSLIKRKFNKNEMVTFVQKHSNMGTYGKIVEILDSDCTEYKIEERVDFDEIKFHSVHCSRIYRNGPKLFNVVNAIDHGIQNKMDMTVLLNIHQNDYLSMDIFNALTEIYTNYAKQSKNITKDVHYQYVGKFIAKNVMDFCLKDKEYNLINCIMEYQHRFMKLTQVWQNSVRNSILLQKTGVKTNCIQDRQCFSCDLCGREVSRYDYIYKCNAKLLDQHFFCLECVWDIYLQHKQLTVFLKKYLRNYLYDVCIQEISSFVCGSVVHSHSNC